MSTYDQRGQQVNTQINIAGLAAAGGCPSCNLIDKVDKVTTIFSSGVSGTANLNGIGQSLLSQKLAPPIKPSAKGKSCWEVGIAICLFGAGGYGLLYMLVCLGYTVFLIVEAIYTATPLMSIEAQPGVNVLGWTFASLIPGVFGGGLIWAGRWLYRNAGITAKKRAEKVAAQMPKWEIAMSRWKNLYYCSRDDGVFDLEEKTLIPAENMMEYLYR